MCNANCPNLGLPNFDPSNGCWKKEPCVSMCYDYEISTDIIPLQES